MYVMYGRICVRMCELTYVRVYKRMYVRMYVYVCMYERMYVRMDATELVDRFRLLEASRQAGHNGHDSEILSIIKELCEAGLIINL